MKRNALRLFYSCVFFLESIELVSQNKYFATSGCHRVKWAKAKWKSKMNLKLDVRHSDGVCLRKSISISYTDESLLSSFFSSSFILIKRWSAVCSVVSPEVERSYFDKEMCSTVCGNWSVFSPFRSLYLWHRHRIAVAGGIVNFAECRTKKRGRSDSSGCSVRLKLSVVWTKSIRRFNRPNQVVKANKTIGNSLRNGQIIRLSSWLLCVLAHSAPLSSRQRRQQRYRMLCTINSTFVFPGLSTPNAKQRCSSSELHDVDSVNSVAVEMFVGRSASAFSFGARTMRHCMLYDEIIESKAKIPKRNFRRWIRFLCVVTQNPVRNCKLRHAKIVFPFRIFRYNQNHGTCLRKTNIGRENAKQTRNRRKVIRIRTPTMAMVTSVATTMTPSQVKTKIIISVFCVNPTIENRKTALDSIAAQWKFGKEETQN